MKNMLQNQEFRFNEVLFEHRNKEYGAYALRNESGRILTKALFAGAALMAAVSLVPLAVNIMKNDVSEGPGGVEIHLTDPVLPPDVIVPPVTVPVRQQIQQTKVKTTDDRLPEPAAHITNEKVVEKIEGAVSGVKNSAEGETAPANTYVAPAPAITGPVSIAPPPKAETKTDDSGGIPTVVDVEASFPGGVNAFRNKVMNSFDGSGMETDEVMKTTVTFIVEKDGSISGLKAEGKNADFNNEALRTIRLIRGKWIPAKVKNQPVRSYFRFPITMKLDN